LRGVVGSVLCIRDREVRQQKTDRRDAALLLKLLLEGRFPRIWTPVLRNGISDSCCCTGTSWLRCECG